MKKTILLILVLLCGVAARGQVSIPYSEYNYNVHYHWGLIDVMIAHGIATVQTNGNRFTATLDGNSIPWNGRVFCVSDTLITTMSPGAGFSNEKVDYINGWYMKPKTSLYRSSSFNPNDAANYKNIKGEGKLDASGNTMEAITVTADMLALYYYFREIDFESMNEGARFTLPFTGEDGSANKVVITYEGKSQFKADETLYHTYAVKFEYSYGDSMSGYPVECQIAADSRIPLLFSASLPVGKVEMIYHE